MKKTYQKPRLRVYGDIRHITATDQPRSMGMDGGKGMMQDKTH